MKDEVSLSKEEVRLPQLPFKAIHGEALLHLKELVHPHQPARQLWSATQGKLTWKGTAKTQLRLGNELVGGLFPYLQSYYGTLCHLMLRLTLNEIVLKRP